MFARKALHLSQSCYSLDKNGKHSGGAFCVSEQTMSKQQAVTWNGIAFESITHAANALGISRTAMSRRIKKEYQRDSDVGVFKSPTPCRWNGKHYPSVLAMSIELGIPYSTAKFRLKQGWENDTDIPELRNPSDQLQELPDGRYSISLTRGYKTIVDGEDKDLAQHRWCANLQKCRSGYVYIQVQRNVYPDGRHHTEIMARVILERELGRPLHSTERVDHADGDTLNNRRNNLRVATARQNRTNSRTGRNSKSGIKGVNRTANGRWGSRIKISGRDIHLGTFDTKEEAHDAYCRVAREHFGEFARFE